MDYKFGLVLCLYCSSIYSAPMARPLMPLEYWMQPQNPLVQIQNPFFRQNVNSIQPPFIYPPQRIIVLLPNPAPPSETDDRYVKLNEEATINGLKTNTGLVDENKDAVIVDAEPNPPEVDPKKATVLMPNNPRYWIGEIISYIPFLPIEINVPDSISWIASHLPGWFGGSAQRPGNMTRLSNRGPIPLVVLPEAIMASM